MKVWKLGMIFVLAAIVFSAMRWQPEPWLRAKIYQVAEQQHLQLSYSHISLHGLSAEMRDVQVQNMRMAHPVRVEKLTVRPLLSTLWSGSPGIRATAYWRGQVISASIRQMDGKLDIHDVDGVADVAMLKPLWQRHAAMKVDVQGRVNLSGRLLLNAQTGQPLEGELAVDWQGAEAALAGMNMSFGDYHLSLLNADQTGQWQWQVHGGKGLTLHADGKLVMAAANPQQWRIHGQAELAAGEGAAQGLTMMLGNGPMRLRLSGTLLRPKWQVL